MSDFLCIGHHFAFATTFSSKGLSACQNQDLSTEMRLFESHFTPFLNSPIRKIRTKQIFPLLFKAPLGFF